MRPSDAWRQRERNHRDGSFRIPQFCSSWDGTQRCHHSGWLQNRCTRRNARGGDGEGAPLSEETFTLSVKAGERREPAGQFSSGSISFPGDLVRSLLS